MRRHKFVSGKKRAQAMVEFALALPILLLLLYGILEAGRLLFIYSSVVTASRQAVRYGSATGMGLDYSPDGPNNSTYERYRDCYGIRRAAQRADFLNAFEDSDIRIYYDRGPDNPTSKTEICTGGAGNWADYGPNNETRLVVEIDGDFIPIVPRIVPFMRRSADDSPADPIEGNSARTILVSVSIYVTAPPSTWVPSTPTFTATFTASPTNTPTSTVEPSPTSTMTATASGPVPTAMNTSTATIMPTSTATGTATSTGTVTPLPTATGTTVSQCMQITSSGTFTKSGNTMTVTITNPNSYPITINNVFVVWNADRGHTSTGQGDDTLDLQSASLGSTVFWTGNIDGAQSASIVPTSIAAIPASAMNLTVNFNFHQTYDRWDTPPTEQVSLTFNNPTGCQLNILNIVRQ